MKCAWEAYLNILPVWLRTVVDESDCHILQEIRLRIGQPVEIVTKCGSTFLNRRTGKEDISFVVNLASKYSPWTSRSVADGYITAPGGHRIGLCGTLFGGEDSMTIRDTTSLCLRVARDFPGISKSVASLKGSTLIVGKPGSGKTTFLRDFIREKSNSGGQNVAVADERCEIFPQWQDDFCFSPGKRTDVLSGCKKGRAIEILLRVMTPDIIALDEITAEEDCSALIFAAWCGVDLVATVHANDIEDLRRRAIYRKLIESGIFHNFIMMRKDKTWTLERMVV